MSWKMISAFLASFSIIVTINCAGLEKSTDFATSIIPHEVDEKLFSQVPENKKGAIDPLLNSVRNSKGHLELANALVDKKEAELDLEKTKKDLAEIELEICEAELNLGKMEAVQSAGLGDARKVNQQVAKLEAKVYKLKAEEAKQKAKVKNAQLAMEEAQKKVEDIKIKTKKGDTKTETQKK